jgi:steroid 5-alpha reductase family enzyme
MTIIILSLILIVALNLLAYFWAYKNQSDKLTDITYSLCFIILSVFLYFYNNKSGVPELILTSMVVLWGLRLGGFLLFRILSIKKDERFDDFRNSKSGFLKFWILQSVSIWLLSLPIIIGLTTSENMILQIPALLLFIGGWLLETIADFQKFYFKQKYGKNTILQSGIYRFVRHPNYAGEIMVWVAVFWYVSPVLKGWQWLSIISPLWLITLLLFISGIPLIEKVNLLKYKDMPEYQKYVKRSKRLIPFIY